MSTLNNTVFVSSNLLEQFAIFYFIISYLAKALSLGLRLTANMIDSFALFFIFNIIFDSVVDTEFLFSFSFIPTFICSMDKNPQGTQDDPKVSAAIIYSNAGTDKLQILSENKGKAGIYMWTHILSGKRYIGSAVDLSKRLRDYYNQSYLERYKTIYICNALIMHSHTTFSLSILEYINNKELLIQREQYYINTLEPEYNILKFAGSYFGYKHTEGAIIKMSEAKKGEKSLMYGKTGKTHTPEALAKISLAQLGKTHSIETISKIIKSLSGENNPMSKNVFVYSFDPSTKETILYKSFNSCIGAAKYFDCSTRTISTGLPVDKKRLYKKQWFLSSLNLLDPK